MGRQRVRLRNMVRCSLCTEHAFPLNKAFHPRWDTVPAAGTASSWSMTAALRLRIKVMKSVVRLIPHHWEPTRIWFRARVAESNHVEGLNNNAKTHHEKVLRLEIPSGAGSRAASCPWQASQTETRPRIPVRRRYPASQRASRIMWAGGRRVAAQLWHYA